MGSGQASSVPLVRPEPSSAWGTIGDKRWLGPNHMFQHSLSQVTSCRRWGLAWSFLSWLQLRISSDIGSMKSLSWQNFPHFCPARDGSRLREARSPHNWEWGVKKTFPMVQREGPPWWGIHICKQNGRCAHHERETQIMTISAHLCL